MSILRLAASCLLAMGAAAPVAAQTNDYGGYDIVAFEGSETFYGESRGWNTFAAYAPSGFAFCFAEKTRSDGQALRLGWDGMQWQLAVPVPSNPDWQGSLQIDGLGSGQGYGRGGDYISGTAVGGWTIAWMGMAELDGLRKGSVAVLGVGKADFDFSLSGSTSALLKVEECVSRSGATAAAQPAQPNQGQAQGGGQGQFASSGTWVINEIVAGGGVLACEAYDSANPVLRFEIDRDNSYIDFFAGRDGQPGTRLAGSISFGPGDPPMPVMTEVIEGRDGNAWARITEGRADGPGLIDDAFQNSSQVTFQAAGLIVETGLYGSKQALSAYFRCSDGIR